MSEAAPFAIDLARSFPHLPAAPIVEAVIEWRARANRAWQPDELRKDLSERLPEYPKVDLQHFHEVFFEATVGNTEKPPIADRSTSWHGIRMESQANRQIAQFTRDGFVFSRLRPYEDWNRFSSEARRLWKVFLEVAAPSEIQRLGVRFINRINSANFRNLRDYLNELPSFSTDLQLSSFVYQSRFDVPGHPLGVRIVKTMQPQPAANANESGLIIDIDVFTEKPLACEDQVLENYLPKMRWLKNKVFFDLLRPGAIEEFK